MSLAVLTGCAATEQHFPRIINEPRPLPRDLTASLGTTTILPVRKSEILNHDNPLSTTEAMGAIGGATFATLLQPTLEAKDMEPKEVIAAVSMELLLSSAAGIVGGLFAGVPEADQRRASLAMRTALQEEPFLAGILREMNKRAARRGVTNLICSAGDLVTKYRTPELADDEIQTLREAGLDSVILIGVKSLHFEALTGVINPGMVFAARVEIQILKLDTREPLHAGHLDFRGHKRTFSKWGANQARLFRAELKRAEETVAEVLLDQVYPRSKKRL